MEKIEKVLCTQNLSVETQREREWKNSVSRLHKLLFYLSIIYLFASSGLGSSVILLSILFSQATNFFWHLHSVPWSLLEFSTGQRAGTQDP